MKITLSATENHNLSYTGGKHNPLLIFGHF
jgi:hypothetical protein